MSSLDGAEDLARHAATLIGLRGRALELGMAVIFAVDPAVEMQKRRNGVVFLMVVPVVLP